MKLIIKGPEIINDSTEYIFQANSDSVLIPIGNFMQQYIGHLNIYFLIFQKHCGTMFSLLSMEVLEVN